MFTINLTKLKLHHSNKIEMKEIHVHIWKYTFTQTNTQKA